MIKEAAQILFVRHDIDMAHQVLVHETCHQHQRAESPPRGSTRAGDDEALDDGEVNVLHNGAHDLIVELVQRLLPPH